MAYPIPTRGGASSSSQQSQSQNQSTGTQNESKRANVTPVACEACRKRRSKCDGKRPTCSTCEVKGVTKCIYEPEIDGSRSKFLRQHNRALQNEILLLRERLGYPPAALSETSPKGVLAPFPDGPDISSERFEDEACTSPRSDTTKSLPGQITSGDEGADDRNQHLDQSTWPGDANASVRAPHMHGPCCQHQRSVPCDGCVHLFSGSTPSNIDWTNGRGSRNQVGEVSLPIYMVQPVNKPHDDPMSTIYTSFRDYARHAIANGGSIDRILGSPDLDASVDLSRDDSTSQSDLSRWASQVVSSYREDLSLAARLAAIQLHITFMRWQVRPSEESFNKIPELMRPLPSQLTIPHFAICDFVQWPAVRDVLIHDPEKSPSFDWVNVVVATMDLAKTFRPDEIFFVDPATSELRLLDSFKKYVENPCHWVTGVEVGEVQPVFKGRVHLR